MYLLGKLQEFGDKKIKLFIDMDGVIVDYILGAPQNYDTKRPLLDRIKKLEIVSKTMPNVELFILSATRYSSGYAEKEQWLDEYAPFFKKENRIILSREENNMEDSADLKAIYLRNYERDGSIMVVIDDDPKNLFAIKSLNDDIILYKDSVLSDDTAIQLGFGSELEENKEGSIKEKSIFEELLRKHF